MGFRHEVAALEIQFDRIEPEGEPSVEIHGRVLQVENAREHVKDGVIHGIRSFNAPQDHLSGRVGYLLTWHPDTMWILPAYHAVLPVLPEPELYFPPGTDLQLELAAPLPVATLPVVTPADPGFAPAEKKDLATMAVSFPERTMTPQGLEADVVNLAFVGTTAQLKEAFEAAGWKRSEPMSGRAVLREMNAFLMLRNYDHGPISKQLLQDQPSDSSWEKGLNSLAKRDHLRIWSTPETWKGAPIWLSSSTRDVGAKLSLRKARFVHYVEPNIDRERGRIVRDLFLAGCVRTFDNFDRPAMAKSLPNATGDEMHTDGAIAVVQLKECSNPVFRNDPEAPRLAARPNSEFVRYIRTQVLSARDMWRENIVYDGFSATRASVRAIRRHHRRIEREQQEHGPRTPTTLTEHQTDLPIGCGADAVERGFACGIPSLANLTPVAQP
jgi:hypothetical protein